MKCKFCYHADISAFNKKCSLSNTDTFFLSFPGNYMFFPFADYVVSVLFYCGRFRLSSMSLWSFFFSFVLMCHVQERKEREAQVAEGGWTVVKHHKGRKKTTDSESGITVGSVAPAAVENQTKKKPKEVGLEFYRFQKREAQKSGMMSLTDSKLVSCFFVQYAILV